MNVMWLYSQKMQKFMHILKNLSFWSQKNNLSTNTTGLLIFNSKKMVLKFISILLYFFSKSKT